MSPLYVDLAIPVAVDTLFTYSVPQELHHAVKKGVRVVAPFGKRTVIGFVVATTHLKPQTPNLKSISDVLDLDPVVSEDLLNLTKWIAEYYLAPWGEVLKAVLVQGSTTIGKRLVALTGIEELSVNKKPISPKQTAIIAHLAQRRTLNIQQLQKLLKTTNVHSTLNELSKRGIIRIEEELPHLKLKPKFEQTIEIDATTQQRCKEWLDNNEPKKTTAQRLKQHDVIVSLLSHTSTIETISLTQFLKSSGTSLSSVKTLVRNGVITIGKREIQRTSEFDLYESSLGAQNIILNHHQEYAVNSITEAIAAQIFHPFLLHGVTGSGKTQVYIEAIRNTLNQGKTAIVLVPEISLTPQIVRRFKQHFQEKVVVMHSRMSIGERFDAWRLAREGKCSVVIGPRSAVFAPLKNIGLIVVDEEQEASYKQFDQSPRYHARDVAIVRAQSTGAVVVLGSATPSFESYANAETRKYTLLEMPDRVDHATMPMIRIVDMTEERKKKFELFRQSRKEEFIQNREAAQQNKRTFEFGSISDLLREHIESRLHKKEGIILLQNRRGFSPFVECPDCGHVEMCKNCNISLTYHLAKKHLRCHYCGSVKQPPDVCPQCHSVEIQYRGFGTQRVEEELAQLFPQATILRMDLDTTTTRGAHDKILRTFSDGHADILLGTQMVAKGLDFSRVTLVGVISADTQMLLPDFRSAERTFQLLTQVAGRAGRSTLAGEVIIQTCQPQHYALRHVLTHDFIGFYREELTFRKELYYPPFSRLILIEFRGEHEPEVMRHAQEFARGFKRNDQLWTMLGPASAAIPKLKGKFRWHIVLKSLKDIDPSGQRIHQAIHRALQSYKNSSVGKSTSVKVIIDVDPVGMM